MDPGSSKYSPCCAEVIKFIGKILKERQNTHFILTSFTEQYGFHTVLETLEYDVLTPVEILVLLQHFWNDKALCFLTLELET